MDRTLVYPGQVPRTLDQLNAGRFTLTALAKVAEAVLGTGTVVAQGSFAVTPTSPASMNIAIGPGQIYEQEQVEATAVSSLGVETHLVLKQGVNLDGQSQTLTAPSTVGYSQNILIQAQYQDSDDGSLVLTYQNPNDKSSTYQGPGGNGQAQYTIRRGIAAITLKAGIAASSGTQTTPSPDSGCVGLYVVTLSFGQTTITTGNIAQFATAPFIPVTLPAVPSGVQNGTWIYGIDTGAAGALVAALYPVPASGPDGMEVRVKAANPAAGSDTVNIGGLGVLPILRRGGLAPLANDWGAGEIISLRKNGSTWRLGGLTPSDVLAITKTLTGSSTYYVNGTTGADTNDGLTSGTALATLQAAANKIANYNLNGFNITINVAPGTYAAVVCPSVSGSGTVNWIGVPSTPSTCFINSAGGPAIYVAGGQYSFNGFRVAAQDSGVNAGNGVLGVGGGTYITLKNMDFNYCTGSHIASDQARIGLTNGITISQSTKAHMNVINGGSIQAVAGAAPSLTISATVTMTTAFLYTNTNGVISCVYSSITGASSVSGSKYSSNGGGQIVATGLGVNYYPGTTAGTTSYGGQYQS